MIETAWLGSRGAAAAPSGSLTVPESFEALGVRRRRRPTRPFVCKRLSTRARGEPEAERAMEYEARALRAIDGRGAPRLVDAGWDELGPWLVMQRVDMRTLAERGASDLE